MSVQGLIARSAADLHLSMPAIIAADPRDPFHVSLPWRGAPMEGPIRVAFARDDFGFGLHTDVVTALDKQRRRFRTQVMPLNPSSHHWHAKPARPDIAR